MIKFYGIIPARYSSTRFPGKPLAMIAGKPMFWHVATRAAKCPNLTDVVLATDDVRISALAKELGIHCIMTRPDHSCGTDRVCEAADILGASDMDVIINIQGDEPLLNPDTISSLIAPFLEEENTMVTTPVCPITDERAETPNQVKVVLDNKLRALYFSRAKIPFLREISDATKIQYWGHIGLYAFRFSILRQFVAWGSGYLEEIEKLEQLRFLEHGIPIKAVKIASHAPGVDTIEDLERVRVIMEASQ